MIEDKVFNFPIYNATHARSMKRLKLDRNAQLQGNDL
jgi:hypothetical protein